MNYLIFRVFQLKEQAEKIFFLEKHHLITVATTLKLLQIESEFKKGF